MDLLEKFKSKYPKEKITPIAEKKELVDKNTVSKRILPAVDKAIASLSESEREEFFERAAIMEYDGGLKREEAERQALERILAKRGNLNGTKSIVGIF